MLLSLAGIPLTAGFVGKFFLVAAGAQSALWGPILILVITSVIGLFYYVRIIVAMYSQAPEEKALVAPRALAPSETVVLAVAASLAVWLGVYPSPLLRVIEALVK
jgi:NADH-quinone oxidoreductase subunit N